MVVQGRVQNSVIVFPRDIKLPEGQEVTVIAHVDSKEQQQNSVSAERQAALRSLFGIWKTTLPPNDEQVSRMVHQNRMQKYA